MDTAGGGRPIASVSAAERLLRLSMDHGLGVAALLATLARDLAAIEARHRLESACADDCARLRLQAEHEVRVAGRLVAAATGLVEVGGVMRAGFSRLLTEQLASGNHGLMDAFQEFFAVLPEQDVDTQRLLGLAVSRTGGALGEMSGLLAPVSEMSATPVMFAPATAAG